MTTPYPTITFSVNLAPLTNEAIGPTTNSTSTGVLSPDMYQGADQGRVENSNRASLVSTLLATLGVSPDKVSKDGDTFVEYGQKAVYLRKMYAVGYAPDDRAYLTVVSVA